MNSIPRQRLELHRRAEYEVDVEDAVDKGDVAASVIALGAAIE